MIWFKLGPLFVPQNEFDWMYSHASCPFVEVLPDGKWLVYFSSRNKINCSHVSALIIDPHKDFKVIRIASFPLISPGNIGLFDDSGCSMGYLLKVNGKRFLYYLGWNLKVTVPWLNSIGLAFESEYESDNYDFPNFVKYGNAPIIDRSNEDPYSISYPCLILDNGIYKMWYGSNLSWGETEREMNHVIKYAESSDAIHWHRFGKIILNHMHPNEFAISKPCVINDNLYYKMWYSYRGNGLISTYRIGYAESKDGINWIRKDGEVGIDVSASGWDSEMICYPFVFDYEGNRYMLYNGNGYGKTGFGLAILEHD